MRIKSYHDGTEPHTLTPTLSRFAVEGTPPSEPVIAESFQK